MKVLKSVTFLMAIMLSGCAHYVGYQRSYAGYGSGYGMGSYYGYPGGSYYQPGASIYYGRQYAPPRASHHYDWQEGRHFEHRTWQPERGHDYAPRSRSHAPDTYRHQSDYHQKRSWSDHHGFRGRH